MTMARACIVPQCFGCRGDVSCSGADDGSVTEQRLCRIQVQYVAPIGYSTARFHFTGLGGLYDVVVADEMGLLIPIFEILGRAACCGGGPSCRVTRKRKAETSMFR